MLGCVCRAAYHANHCWMVSRPLLYKTDGQDPLAARESILIRLRSQSRVSWEMQVPDDSTANAEFGE